MNVHSCLRLDEYGVSNPLNLPIVLTVFASERATATSDKLNWDLDTHIRDAWREFLMAVRSFISHHQLITMIKHHNRLLNVYNFLSNESGFWILYLFAWGAFKQSNLIIIPTILVEIMIAREEQESKCV